MALAFLFLIVLFVDRCLLLALVINVSIGHPSIHLSIYLSMYLSVCCLVRPSGALIPVSLCVYTRSICLFIIDPSFYQSPCLSCCQGGIVSAFICVCHLLRGDYGFGTKRLGGAGAITCSSVDRSDGGSNRVQPVCRVSSVVLVYIIH